jgi:hypothetical protein
MFRKIVSGLSVAVLVLGLSAAPVRAGMDPVEGGAGGAVLGAATGAVVCGFLTLGIAALPCAVMGFIFGGTMGAAIGEFDDPDDPDFEALGNLPLGPSDEPLLHQQGSYDSHGNWSGTYRYGDTHGTQQGRYVDGVWHGTYQGAYTK